MAMTLEGFIDYCMEACASPNAVRNTSCELYDGDVVFWKRVVAYFSESQLTLPVTRKAAARIIHACLQEIYHVSDLDWDKARLLKDIYECRVCANSVAQVYERGIIGESAPGVFGINLVMTDEELEKAIRNMIIQCEVKKS